MYSWNKEKQLRRRPDEDRSESSPGPRNHYARTDFTTRELPWELETV